jgi:ATP-dependent Clp protease protease subunit
MEAVMSDKNTLDELLTFGIDIEKRRIYFGAIDSDNGSDVGWTSIELAIRGMHRMYEKSSSPIEIHMSCPGGDPYEMLRLVDEIETAPVQVRFVGSGLIASAATWIMAVCDLRSLHKNTYVLVHDGSDQLEDRHTDFQITAKHFQSLQDRLYDIFEQNSRMPKTFWQDVCQRDLYLTAEETVMFGLADKVIQPRKRGSARRARNLALSQSIDNKLMQKSIKNVYDRINKKNVPKLVFNQVPQEEMDDSISE